MGRIVIVQNFTRALRNSNNISDVVVDSGGGANITAEHYADVGDDSYPLETDYAVIVATQRTGSAGVVGYADVINTPKALAGDKRIYARDGNGISVVDVWLKSDGSVNITNANGSVVLLPSGDVNINGAVIDAAGNITSPGTITAPNLVGTASVQADGKELVDHDHLAGTPPGNTGPNL